MPGLSPLLNLIAVMARKVNPQTPGLRAIDTAVGKRLRARRLEIGLSQGRLARSVGITFQQIQKYERGSNRVVASRLFDLARVLNVPIDYFFQDLPGSDPRAAKAGPAQPLGLDLLARLETSKLLRAYHEIPDPKIRRRLLNLVKATVRAGL
jgi:transcriptional regulator with XRE-family HTH domain